MLKGGDLSIFDFNTLFLHITNFLLVLYNLIFLIIADEINVVTWLCLNNLKIIVILMSTSLLFVISKSCYVFCWCLLVLKINIVFLCHSFIDQNFAVVLWMWIVAEIKCDFVNLKCYRNFYAWSWSMLREATVRLCWRILVGQFLLTWQGLLHVCNTELYLN